MKKRRARTNAEVANFVMGCRDASQLQREIHTIMDDKPIDLDRLQLRLREAIGAVKSGWSVRPPPGRDSSCMCPWDRA
jgi:hypothetical protein